MPKILPRPSKECLEQEYIIEKKSLRIVADAHSCDPRTVAAWLHHYGIPTRGGNEVRRTPHIPKEELEKYYVVEGLSSTEIGKIYGCSFAVILKRLRRYGIEVRSAGGRPLQSPTREQMMTRDRQRPVCDTLRKHAEDLKDDPERLSTEFMQKIIGVKC